MEIIHLNWNDSKKVFYICMKINGLGLKEFLNEKFNPENSIRKKILFIKKEI